LWRRSPELFDLTARPTQSVRAFLGGAWNSGTRPTLVIENAERGLGIVKGPGQFLQLSDSRVPDIAPARVEVDEPGF